MNKLLELLEPTGIRRTIKKRSILLYQGEVPRSAYFLKKGVMKVYSINSSGNEQIVGFVVEGDLFPLPWIFGKTSSSLYYNEALTDCTVIAVDKDTLVNKLNENKELYNQIFDFVMTGYTSYLLRITSLEQSRARDKILFTLYYLVFRYGVEIKPGIFSVRLGLTQATIADMVGVTRETTVVELSRLKKLGVVKYNVKEYVINKHKLERILGEDSFSEILN